MHHLIPDFAKDYTIVYGLILAYLFAAFCRFVEWKYGGEVEAL